MRKRFTKNELWELRNLAPIRMVIEEKLQIPNRIVDGSFRFQCPICLDFHTGIKTETNLARCFDCNENFNPIEIVMKSRNASFYESARFIRKLLDPCRRGPTRKENVPEGANRAFERERSEPSSVGSILENAELFGGPTGVFPKRIVDNDLAGAYRRIEKLEKEMARLERRLEQLKTFTVEIVAGKR